MIKTFKTLAVLFVLQISNLYAGTIFMLDDSGYLSSFDEDTLLTTNIGATGILGSFEGGMTFDAAGTLYAQNLNGDLYSINTATGAATHLGNSGIGGEGLAIDLASGELLTVNGQNLFRINQNTLQSTFIRNGVIKSDGMSTVMTDTVIDGRQFDAGDIFLGLPVEDIWVMDPDAPGANYVYTRDTNSDYSVMDESLVLAGDRLIGHNWNRGPGGAGELWVLNLAGGPHSLLASTTSEVRGMAYQASAVPEPSTYALMFLGLATLVGYKRKKK